jgi:hypothetical protein
MEDQNLLVSMQTAQELLNSESPRSQEEPPTMGPLKRKWTLLMYSAADNDLEKYLVQDADEIERVGSSGNMSVVLQLDRGKNPSELSGGWKGCRRFLVRQNTDPEGITSPVLKDMGQVNMSDPKVLQDFIEWGMETFPAEHYLLLISDHGQGWKGAIRDDSHKGWMSLPDINKAMGNAEETTGRKIDILGFDACLMAQSEVAYELKDRANYMVASEDLEGAKGWPYHKVLTQNVVQQLQKALLMKTDVDPEILAKFIVKAAAADKEVIPTLSAIDMKNMDGVAKATDKFARAIIDSDTPGNLFKTIIRKSQTFEGFKDHFDFASRIKDSEDIKDEKLKEAAQGVMDAVKAAVLYEEHSSSYNSAHGLTIHLPSFRMDPPPEYKKIAFARDTMWDEALTKMENSRGASGAKNSGDPENVA